jgi:pyruvate,water dikinase
VNEARQQDRGRLDTPALLQRLEYWIQRTLFDFARDSLKPTALAAIALGNLERALAPRFASGESQTNPEASGLPRAQALLRELTMCVRPDPDADLPGAIRALASGELDRDVFLQRFGHRGSQEMELSQPRWAENPALVDAMRRHEKKNQGADALRSPVAWQDTWERIANEAKLTPFQRAALEGEVQTLLTYLALRESAKHYLMQGYAIIRQTLVELDRRFQLDGGIFFLTPQELTDLGRKSREEIAKLIEQRRRRRDLALSLPVPQVLFSDDLEAIGRRVEHAGTEVLQGVPLSAGVTEGPALVLLEPTLTEEPAEPYILVCPSTDPAWVPLFVQARGLLMETGGVLSHGAIVAREFGLPAVAGLPDVHRRLRTGQRLRVDGATGQVQILE